MPFALRRILILMAAITLPALLTAACTTSPAPSQGPAASPEPAAPGGFVRRTLTIDGVAHVYQVFVPSSARLQDAGGRRPVVLFLHGSGERGDDGVKQTEVGLGPYLRRHARDFPAIVVFPQSPPERSWDGDVAAMAFAMLDAASAEFGGDPDRTYLTGMSRGGYGTWELALLQPRRFAALVPVCGGITSPRAESPLTVEAVAGSADPFMATAERLRELPVWIFHGGLDDVVPPEQSRRMNAALEATGADVRYTEFPDANHNSWDATYGHAPMWDWLFAQQRRR
ncbi:prolyl oligopeptidase family serine peptidase [Marilutibacter chinensis]|uniref:Prolyl oligopeptidase family serine peptidase n=1 Tax=Marilutibacter chinensis TaxID=2912247 RepID=A0ABS9HWF0_9GAMM|nr:prolyl oligopeptidase family serine peptidase [Lysobacter chinensis]MCF7222485.1 prolyl oligopeptidase family serine peptidase [Lysobacter chinensis]